MKARLIPLIAVFALAGCSKIHEEKTFTLEPGNSHTLDISAPLSEQKVNVALTSDEPVNVYVLLLKSVEGKTDYDPDTMKEGVLAKEKSTKSATLTATVPAKEKYRIYVDGATKKANVSVKVDSQ